MSMDENGIHSKTAFLIKIFQFVVKVVQINDITFIRFQLTSLNSILI